MTRPSLTPIQLRISRLLAAGLNPLALCGRLRISGSHLRNELREMEHHEIVRKARVLDQLRHLHTMWACGESTEDINAAAALVDREYQDLAGCIVDTSRMLDKVIESLESDFQIDKQEQQS